MYMGRSLPLVHMCSENYGSRGSVSVCMSATQCLTSQIQISNHPVIVHNTQ